MKSALKICLFILSVVLFSGGACPSNETTLSNKVAQSEIYQSYAITQNGVNYDVTAYFRVGGKTGTTLALSAPSTVSFNGQRMEEHLNTSSGTFYTTSVPTGTATATFAFMDRNSKIYTNTADLSRSTLTTAVKKINGTIPVVIPLSRPPANSASFTLNLNGQTIFVDQMPGDMSEVYYDRTKNAIVIRPAAWKKVPRGNIAIDLDVNNVVSTTQGTALGGEISFKYGTAPVNVAFFKQKSRTARQAANTNATAQTSTANQNAALPKVIK